MTHHSNYFPKGREDELKLLIEANAITGPAFVGCGYTRQVGSDSYGGYVVSIDKTKKGKPVIGLVEAHTEFGPGGWTAGTELCCLPGGKTDPEECTPTHWVTTYGKYKNGDPKWWFCSKEGERYKGRMCHYGWGYASAYSDPSF